MGGITKQCQATFGPGGQGFAIVERPPKRLVYLRQQMLDPRIPAFELRPQRVGVSGRGPGFFHFLVRGHETDIIDDLSMAHGKDKEVF